jgi:branched-chain amino acid transport system ATP-binding protein
MNVLKITNLQVGYGSGMVIKGICLEAKKGDVRVILGANGAGKTTIMKTVIGVLKPMGGEIEFPPGRQIQGLPAHKVVRLGITLCPERRGILTQMNVLENLEMGAYFKSNKSETKSNLNKMFDRFPILSERRKQFAGSLSGGEQQMLAIARSLMSGPDLLLLDEPSLGLAPLINAEIFKTIREISSTGVTILLVEQNAKQALRIASWVYVLETGVIKVEDTPDKLLQDETIKKAYLGD